jgi:tRNA (guanine26-N2/guanine27-N2)-dimethyltransferase
MEIMEGSAVIHTGVSDLGNAPGSVVPGFFNQVQRLNRDLTVILCFNLRPRLYLDGFSGTGIRAIRIAKEAGVKAVLSEKNWKAFEITRKNIASNDVDLESHNASFESLVSSYGFDFIDVDPYGSAFPYIDAALNYVRNRGYIGITATDLSTLSGSMREKSIRRYGGFVINDRMKHEFGIRLLLGYIARRAAGYDRGIYPVLSMWKGHYYRIIFRVNENLSHARESLNLVRPLNKHDSIASIYQSTQEGPVWSGEIQDENILGSLSYPEGLSHLREYVLNLVNENMSTGFLELSDFASHHHSDIPSMENSLGNLRNSGIKAERTIFSSTGIKLANMQHDADQYWEILKRQ